MNIHDETLPVVQIMMQDICGNRTHDFNGKITDKRFLSTPKQIESYPVTNLTSVVEETKSNMIVIEEPSP